MHNPTRVLINPALAEAGVNVQHAMTLASHSDARTHMRYVMKTAAMRTIPEAAVPRLMPAAHSATGVGDLASDPSESRPREATRSPEYEKPRRGCWLR
jgi:hypothetical protein